MRRARRRGYERGSASRSRLTWRCRHPLADRVFPSAPLGRQIVTWGWYCSGVFTRAEALAASIVAFLATAIVSSYLGDAIGFALHPLPIFAISCAASIAFSVQGTARGGPFDLLALTTIVIAVLTWLLWLAWPRLLPIGGGTDLKH